jgi:hypothetical protein
VASRRSLLLIPQKFFESNKICQAKEGSHPFIAGPVVVVGLKALKRRNRRVDNVHTRDVGSGPTGGGPGRIPHVSGGVQGWQGLEFSSSPTSGTHDPSSEGFLL